MIKIKHIERDIDKKYHTMKKSICEARSLMALEEIKRQRMENRRKESEKMFEEGFISIIDVDNINPNQKKIDTAFFDS